ncbi:hypothetical protein U1Q18_024756 [Sarracenia purpurea var. burkii]
MRALPVFPGVPVIAFWRRYSVFSLLVPDVCGADLLGNGHSELRLRAAMLYASLSRIWVIGVRMMLQDF